MSMKNSNPTSPGRRFYRRSKSETTAGNNPEKSLLVPLSSTGGRNNLGRITSRHRGGGHKRHYRVIDFKRDKLGVPGVVKTIEYDPNRSANIALIQYVDGEKRYILAPQKLSVGDEILSGASADIRPGNCLKLKYIPLGTVIHNVELKPGKGGQLIRSAGTWGQITAKEGKYALIRLPSGESRHVLLNCRATIGFVANKNHESGSLGKAGRSRWLGRRPHVRGVAMNPVDHPHGGGEGRTSGGRHPVTPWGVPTKGKKTRKNKRTSRFIVRGRKRRNK